MSNNMSKVFFYFRSKLFVLGKTRGDAPSPQYESDGAKFTALRKPRQIVIAINLRFNFNSVPFRIRSDLDISSKSLPDAILLK